MSEETVRNDVRQFVIDNFMFGLGDKLSDQESFLESGVIDSTGVLELVGFLEQRYQITIEHDELVPDNLDSVDNVAQFIERKLTSTGVRLAG